MTATVDKLPFALGITAPEHKNDMLPMVIECTDSRVGEFFPTFVLMTAWVVCFNGQCGIEEQDTLIRPTLEIPPTRVQACPNRGESPYRYSPTTVEPAHRH